jgi:tetratricopeptide repeat protein
MAKNRLTKKQLQTDELQSALIHGRDFVASHQSETKRWVLILGGAAVLVAAIVLLVNARSARYAARFSHALAIFDAPLVTDGAGTAPGMQVYKDAAERTAAARKELEALVKDAPSTTAGRAAAVLLVSMDGKSASGTRLDQVKAFASSQAGTVSAGIAAVTLLDAEAAAGRVNEAIETAKRYVDSANSPMPKDVLIFTLAQLYEKAGKPVEARSFYQRVVSEFPDSPMRMEAQQRATSL